MTKKKKSTEPEKPVTCYVVIKKYCNKLGFFSFEEAVNFIASVDSQPREPGEEDDLFEYTLISPEQELHKGFTCLGPAAPMEVIKGGKK